MARVFAVRVQLSGLDECRGTRVHRKHRMSQGTVVVLVAAAGIRVYALVVIIKKSRSDLQKP